MKTKLIKTLEFSRGFSFARGLTLFALVLCALSCNKSAGGEAAAQPPSDNPADKNHQSKNALWGNPDFIMGSPEQPLWFEFNEGGLSQIASPAFASLNSFKPWPFAPFVTGFLDYDGALVISANGLGFVAVYPWEFNGESRIAVKKTENIEDFAGWTMSAPFFFEGKPSILLFNSDFFTEAGVKAPQKREWSLSVHSGRAKHINIPAFSAFPAESGWEIKNHFIGAGGAWYFSASNLHQNPPRLEFYKLFPETGASPEKISQPVFLASREGRPFDEAPPVLRELLYAVAESGGAGAYAVNASSPVFGGEVLFKRGGGEEVAEFSAFYAGEIPYALAVSRDGAVFERPGTFSGGEGGAVPGLPKLPEGFVWTAAGFFEDIIAAAWEERDNYQVGAAGLCFLKLR